MSPLLSSSNAASCPSSNQPTNRLPSRKTARRPPETKKTEEENKIISGDRVRFVVRMYTSRPRPCPLLLFAMIVSIVPTWLVARTRLFLVRPDRRRVLYVSSRGAAARANPLSPPRPVFPLLFTCPICQCVILSLSMCCCCVVHHPCFSPTLPPASASAGSTRH